MASVTLDMSSYTDPTGTKVDESFLLDLTADLDVRFDVVGDPNTSVTLEFTGPVEDIYRVIDMVADDDDDADALAALVVVEGRGPAWA